MLTIKMPNSNNSAYVTISIAPFLYQGAKKLPPCGSQPPTVLGSTWYYCTEKSISYDKNHVNLFS